MKICLGKQKTMIKLDIRHNIGRILEQISVSRSLKNRRRYKMSVGQSRLFNNKYVYNIVCKYIICKKYDTIINKLIKFI